MPEAVVDLLEAVEVEHREGQGGAGAFGDRVLARSEGEEAAAVEQAGERVGRGPPTQAFAEAGEHQAGGPHGAGHNHPHNRHVGQAPPTRPTAKPTEISSDWASTARREKKCATYIAVQGYANAASITPPEVWALATITLTVTALNAISSCIRRAGGVASEGPQPHAYQAGERPDGEVQVHGLAGADGVRHRREASQPATINSSAAAHTIDGRALCSRAQRTREIRKGCESSICWSFRCDPAWA